MMKLTSSQQRLWNDFQEMKEEMKEMSFSEKWPHFVISGPPGVGKSFLLRCLAEEEHAPYVDLEQGRENLQLWIRVRGEIERKGSDFLFLDHVPSGPVDMSLLALEDEVLIPFAKDGGIIVAALCDRDQWSFIQPLRNLHYLLPSDSDKENIENLFHQDSCALSIQEIKKQSYGNLLLAHYLCHRPTREEACRDFLEHWWQRLHLDEVKDFQSFLSVVIPLSEKERVSETSIREIVRRRSEVARILSLLRRARWIGGWSSAQEPEQEPEPEPEQKPDPDGWTSPVQECLKTLRS